MNPSTRPASTSQGAVPSTISTATRASAANATPRRRCPGLTSAHPMRSPAALATATHESSSTPWAVTSSKNGTPLPAQIDRPVIAPNSTPW